MHIPDGFLDGKTILATTALAGTGLGAALWQAKRQLTPRQVPLIGVTAAFLFAAQMVNFPVAGGTSGHLMGGVLAAALVGPAAAVVVMTAVLLVQCFLFQDGGVTSLGANIFNMGVVGTLAGALVYSSLRRLLAFAHKHCSCAPAQTGTDRQVGRVSAAILGGWISTVLASLCCAGELAWSGIVSWKLVFPAMVGIHGVIGIGEGLITALVLIAVLRARPELLQSDAAPTRALPAAAWALVVAAGLALFVSPFACSWPDGLEKVALQLGFDSQALAHPVAAAPFPDYSLSAWRETPWATLIAGLSGAVLVAALAMVATRSKQ